MSIGLDYKDVAERELDNSSLDKELFEKSGGQKLDYVESLNFSDAWVQAIIEIK